jgi:hypothetical protein
MARPCKILVSHILGADNIVDLFTKALLRQKHERLADCIDMRNIEDGLH